MQVLLDTQLMPQYLPGAPASAGYRQVWMAPANNGQPVLFTLDHEHHFTVWLPGSDGCTRWVQVSPSLMGVDNPRIIDVDLISNHGQGRRDNTLDLLLVADVGTAEHSDFKAFYLPGIQTGIDPEAWRLTFAACAPLAASIPVAPVVMVRLGLLPCPVRSVFLVSQHPALNVVALRLRFDDHGHCTAIETLPTDSVDATARHLRVAAFVAPRPLEGDEDALIVAASLFDSGPQAGVSVQLPASRGQPPWRLELRSPLGASAEWRGEVNVNSFVRSDTDVPMAVFNLPSSRDLSQGNFVMTPASMAANDGFTGLYGSLDGWQMAPGPGHAVRLDSAPPGGRWRWLSLVRPAGGASSLASLQMTQSTECLQSAAPSTLVAADVSACNVCQCTEPGTGLSILHILVAHAEGGLGFFSQDSISGQWQRHTVTDDNLQRGLHTSTSYTTRIRVRDDTSAPVVHAAVRLRPHSPCFGLLNGQAIHLSPLAPTVASTASGGEVTFIQPVSSLGAVQIDVEVVETPDGWPLPPGLVPAGGQRDALRASTAVHRVQLNPMANVASRMGAVGSGLNLQQVKASDGTQPFAHLPLDTCNQAFDAMTPLLKAYHATLQPPTSPSATRVVVRRTHLSWKGGALGVAEEALATPVQLSGAFDTIGDILSYLWTAVADAMHDVNVTLNWLADGLCTIAVAIGEVVWTSLVAIASQAAELIDWALQKTLGVSVGDIVHWLGELFDWTAVQENQAVMQQLLTLSLDAAQQWLSRDAPALVDRYRVEAGRWLTEGLPDLDDKAREMLSNPPLSGTPDTTPGARETGSPSTSWVHQKFTDYAGQGSGGAAGDFAAAEDALQLVLDLGADLEKLVDDLVAYFGSIDWQSQSMLSVMENVAGRIGSDLLDLIDHFVVHVLKIIADLVQAIRDVLSARLDMPVLTPLYEHTLGLGTFSLGGGVTLGASLAALTTSRVVAGKDFITPEVRQRVLAATTLGELLQAGPGDSDADLNAAARAAVAALTATCRSVYAASWFIDQFTPALPPTQRNKLVPGIKCSMDCTAWFMSIVMASTFCSRSAPGPGQDFARYNVSNQFFGLITSRFRDVYELRQLQQERVMDPQIARYLDCIEASVGATGYFMTSICMVSPGLAYQDSVDLPDDEKAQWKAELWLPVTQSFVTAVYTLLVARSQVKNPELSEGMRMGRMVSNGLRSVVLPWCQAGTLIDSAAKGWKVPGSVGS